jgi:hypothetical protein
VRAPFPAFGSKRRIADVVWRAFGHDVPNYVEPFCHSAAVLLARPGGAGKIETINDLHGAIPNFWRAVRSDPEAVAYWCDWPVSECDLAARHVWLVARLREIRERLMVDCDFFDAKAAGWWVWGQCQWIGDGWCADTSKKPERKRPQLCDAPCGVHLPSLGNDRGLNGVSAPPALEWCRMLRERLRNVRIACGDFERVLGDSVLGNGKNVGGRRPCAVFLDPPYSLAHRRAVYAEESDTVAKRARDWAVAHGDDPGLLVVLCGYADEHEMPENWTTRHWTGSRGYAAEANQNRRLETIWCSPHCSPIERQRELFETTFGGTTHAIQYS